MIIALIAADGTRIDTSYEFVAWLLSFGALAISQGYSWWDNRTLMKKASAERHGTDAKLHEVGAAVNGRLTQLITTIRAEAFAEGVDSVRRNRRATDRKRPTAGAEPEAATPPAPPTGPPPLPGPLPEGEGPRA